MRAEEFGGWKANNVGKGGKKSSFDIFNKSMKGHERNPSAKEFASQGLEGYHHYAERMDTRTEKEDKKKENKKDNSNSSKSKSSKATNQSSSFVRNIVSRVAVVAVGAVVVVNGYETIQEHEEQKTVADVTWDWSDDNQVALLKLLNSDNTLIKELQTTIYSSQLDPTCTADGSITYIATAEDENGKTYTDTHTEILPASGHKFGEGTEVVDEHGVHSMVYECEHCHEKIEFTISVEEN